ncbi:DUF3307 domain-containing protein [Chitinophaga silvisoli]|uniref:DUF3307 domain-containing protein n=1 Tax=Chitinophaga silvisoli TaxID=2291814 RepID=A0A3E1P1K8_9BACT|nr:DUF3307 domain-containing protein [Chitinophaga silvisoli]
MANKELKKWRSHYLYIHVCIHFILILLVTWNLGLWRVALVISFLHLLIDAIKLQYQRPSTQRAWFFRSNRAFSRFYFAYGLSM